MVCSRSAIRVANEKLLSAYGIERDNLSYMQSPMGKSSRNAAVVALYDTIFHQVDSFCHKIWDKYADGQIDLNWKQFEQWATDSTQIFSWLTDQGKALADQFENLSEMIFDEPDSPPDVGTNLSLSRMKACFTNYSLYGLMDKSSFSRCITDLVTASQKLKFAGLGIQGLLDSLFLVIDVNRSGTLTEDEFTDAMTTIVTGSPQQKIRIALKVHDSSSAGYIQQTTMRNFFFTYFDTALKKVDVLSQSIEEWMTDRSGPSSGPVSELAPNLRKSAAREVSMMADELVEYAMQCRSRGSDKLLPADFAVFISGTTFMQLLASIGTAWMVSDETLAIELTASEKRRHRAESLVSQTAVERQRLAKSAPRGEAYFGLLSRKGDVLGGRAIESVRKNGTAAGDVWWIRCFTNRRHAMRQYRSRNALGDLTLDKVSGLQRRIDLLAQVRHSFHVSL